MVSGLENSVIKVAAIGGSIRKASYSNGLIRAAIELSKESIVGMEIEHLDISQLPMQNIDLEGEDHEGSFPPAVEDLRQKILESDCILFSSPEFNYSVSAPLKNAIDWASRPPNVWADKAAAIISASAGMGGARGQLHLRQIGVFIDLHFINKPEFFLNVFQPPAKFDSQGNLIDENTKERLKEVLLALQAFTWRLKTATNA
uniref:NAD(P)H dehydrogenase (quinone) n=2 Tax=Populus trichocarpa TaxID=3694 RepID=A0A2K2B9P8_POPTR|eukprot:XP_002304803.1 NADPH:quinone oxidoreductase [Populus trichocarpa]